MRLRDLIRRKDKRCCECAARDKRIVIEFASGRWVCFGCAWEFGYPEFCYDSCKVC